MKKCFNPALIGRLQHKGLINYIDGRDLVVPIDIVN